MLWISPWKHIGRAWPNLYIYIQNSITGPCLKIYHSWYINFPRHVFILYTAMPITCYIQFLSLSVLEKYVKHLFQSVYTISLHTRKLALMANNNVQHYNGVSAFTMYICTISYFPVHLKLDFQIFFFFSTWTQPFSRYGIFSLGPYQIGHFDFSIVHFSPAHMPFCAVGILPNLSQIGLFDFFNRAFLPCTYAFYAVGICAG